MPVKILVVEDTADSRNLLHFLFTSKDYHVITAGDGTEGLYLTRAEKPDLVITDLTMPNLNGIDMIAQIRAEPEIAGIPVVIYTAYGAETAQEALTAGADKIFLKPFDLDDLLQYVAEKFPVQRSLDGRNRESQEE